ncbi:MAG: FimV/HubP family polar landmark protein [Gammaproteobacteria bacterium]|nr:FimV/HubP family polar landmark protein [Gammaproteobacteria bacterium]
MIYLSHITEYMKHLFIQMNHLLSPAGCMLSAAFFLSLLVIYKLVFTKKEKMIQPQNVTPPHSVSMDAIAGEDVWTAQLDLARAFFEIGKLPEAKDILDQVTQQGSATQKQEAFKLLEKCS